tara:strand:+ start:1273 stop:1764 length:492 start_codon:yes stop_codon:yes gene_type:complete
MESEQRETYTYEYKLKIAEYYEKIEELKRQGRLQKMRIGYQKRQEKLDKRWIVYRKRNMQKLKIVVRKYHENNYKLKSVVKPPNEEFNMVQFMADNFEKTDNGKDYVKCKEVCRQYKLIIDKKARNKDVRGLIINNASFNHFAEKQINGKKLKSIITGYKINI